MADKIQTSTGTVRESERRNALRTHVWIGAIIGVGVAGTLDEVVFHQLLQWHNFYVHTADYWRIVSDGIFHLFSSVMLFVGVLLLWFKRDLLSAQGDGRALAAGIFLGTGGFNLYDGTIQHKVLRLHPVREGVDNILLYDLAWNVVALLVLVIGLWLWRSIPRDA
jgi:uncharacterized membrane protein